MVRILAIANLGPTPRNPWAGVFLPPRLDGLVAAGNSVQLVLPAPDSRSIRLTDRLRGTDVAGPHRMPKRLPPLAGRTPWQVVPLRMPEWRRAWALAGQTTPMERTLAAAVREQLAPLNVDLIQGHGMYEFWAGGAARELARLLGCPFTVTLHGSDITQLIPSRRRSFRAVADEASGLLFVSEALRREAVGRHLVPGPSAVVPNGIDPGVFHPRGRTSSDRLRVLFVGNLVSAKGADRLPAILTEILRMEPRAHMTVIGDGRLHPALKRALPATHSVLLGRQSVESVAQAMRTSDVLVAPSRSEGWGAVVVEARACGARVVGADVGGLPEAIGTGGEVVSGEPFSPERAAEAVIRQWRRGVSRRSIDDALELTWENIGARESALLESWIN